MIADLYNNPAVISNGRLKMYIPEKGVLSNSGIYFHTPSNTAKSAFFYTVCAGAFYCNQDYRVERETFRSYLIMYIKSGRGYVSFNDRTCKVQANDVVFLNCHHPHLYYTDTGWETLWLHFDGNSSKDFFEYFYNRTGVSISMGESLIVYRYLAMIIEGFMRSKPLPEVLVSSHIHRMLAELLLLSSNDVDCRMDKGSPVLDAVTYIGANFGRRITVDELAAHVRISPYHFSRMFKKATGYAPYEYIIKTRIDHAKVLLKKTRRNVKEIAYEVGFNSESNFVNTFHESVGLTPNEFRNTPV